MIAGGIAYLEQGEGETVIFLHGIGGEAEAFLPLMARLSGYRCIAWNMPGYRDSAPLAQGFSFAALSEALGAFLDRLKAEPVHLVGHSIGGMLALEHAVRQPGQVESLALIGTTPAFGGRDDSFKKAFLEARLAPLERGLGMEQMGAQAAPHLVGPGAGAAVVEEIGAAIGRVPEATWRGILECLVTFDRRSDLARLPHPCCLIAGEHDSNAPARTMARMAEALPDADYRALPGIGHMIPQEAPETVAAILQGFWEDLA